MKHTPPAPRRSVMPADERDRLLADIVIAAGPLAAPRLVRRAALDHLRKLHTSQRIIQLVVTALVDYLRPKPRGPRPRGRVACKPRSRTRGRRR